MGEIRDFKSGRHERPPGDPTPRRLAAIVAGDIAGYSRLMQLDEEGTHNRVKRIERDLIEPTIVEHHGKLVKTTGDGFIAMFDSPVEAVRCSIVIQQNLVGRNAAVPRDYWIEYRIGVNLGDVIIEPDDIYGDGVNVASRLEGIAEPGQVFISGGIYEQIKHKLVCGYESLGDRKVKNITDPVRVYRVLPDAAAFQRTRRRRENVLIFLLSITLAIIAGGILWSLLIPRSEKLAVRTPAPAASPSPAASPKAEPAPATKQAAAPAASPTAQPQPPQPSASPAVTAVAPPDAAHAVRAGARDGRASGRQLLDGQQ
ncbi:adenylate/guanylate cyclase domain-containing protein [Bradyrhizobium sp. Leo121]|uniref:adenylate/guanylate cyclase domain-containing protein n=1 Tax=Bradyrhizobium sp. Leo121 TaxID=1571195 RepID=UPI001FE01B71|nr:adenylate/guanylate cyclase domain-containing protein [Bradyrhizobium sp. Leo121]